MRTYCNRLQFNIVLCLITLAAMSANAGDSRDPLGPASEENDIFFRTQDGEIVGTGAKRPNAVQWAWSEQHMLMAIRVKHNALGLARINRTRAERGQPLLDEAAAGVVPLGAEAQTSGGLVVPLDAVVLPSQVDNSTLPCFPPIRSQGSLNSCGQFASVYYTFTHMTALARNWNAATGGDSYRFSPKWTYNMVNGGENVGSWSYDAYAIAQKHGIATWAEFPYDDDYRGWCLNSAAWRSAINVRADQTGKVLDVETDAGLSQLKQFLVNGYVLNFATYIGSFQWGVIANDPATTADDPFAGKQCVYAVNGTSGGHEMTIVGYNDDIWLDLNGNGVVSADEKGALRIANSWGTGWGEAGFCWLAYQALRTRNPAISSEGVFWFDEATWVTARPAYQPQLIAKFTLNHLKRNQLLMTLGTSGTTSASPTTPWFPNDVFFFAGGPWAFNGTATAVDGTFYLDFTDLLPITTGPERYYLGMDDSTVGDPAALKSYKLVDVVHGREAACQSVPRYADGSQAYAYVDYDFGGGNLPPVAVATASLKSGPAPIFVTLDGSGSRDPDGSIASYMWDLGDGTGGGPGVTLSHIYTQPGTFNATLTVTDNAGAQSSATVTITVTDPNVINAPSGLTATVSGKTVKLHWKDNSTNEQGFRVERAPNTGGGAGVFTLKGTVSAGVTSYSDSSVPSGQYSYRVQAYNTSTGRQSASSNVVSVRVR